MRAISFLRLPILAALLTALASNAAPVKPKANKLGSPLSQVKLAPVAQSGLTALGCDVNSASLSCPDGYLISVENVFFGRDVPVNASDPATCPGQQQSYNCTLSPHDTAALTLQFAQLCDGKQSCTSTPGSWASIGMFGDPCPGTTKYHRVTYSCRSAAIDKPVPPVVPPTGDLLRIRRPGTLAAPKCPKFAQGIINANNAASKWISQNPLDGAYYSISLTFVDFNMSDLATHVQSAMPGVSLDNIRELNITAVNVDFGAQTTVRIGHNNPGFTTVRISAVNIISNGSALDVWSNGPDASGRFGPDVFIKATNVYGDLQVMQNGLTAGHPVVARNNWPLNIWNCPGTAGETCYQGFCGCSDLDNQISLCSEYWFNFRTGFAVCPSDPLKWSPICQTSLPGGCTAWSDNGACFGIAGQWTSNIIYGDTLKGRSQKDGSPWNMQLDRVTWPGYSTAPVKSAIYGSVNYKLGGFMNRAGDAGSASTTSSWPMNGRGISSTADWTIAMDRHPAAAYYSIMEAHGLKPSPTFNGYLDMMFNPTGPDQTMFMLASCPATRNVTGAWVAWMPQATIAHAPATGSGSVALDDIQTQMIANCADEMVSAGSFIDAQAFLADVLPVLGASSPSGSTDPAIGRALSVMANLRVGRKSQAIKVVPYLSAAMITQQANNELSALQGLEQQLLAATTQGVTVDSAKAAVEASLPSMNTQIAAAQVELQGDVQHAASLATAFQALQSTYNDRYKDVQAAKDTFTAGVKKAEGDAIGEIVGEFFLDVVTAIATEGAGAGSLVGLLGKAGGLAKLTTGLEKFTALITTISQMIYNLQQLILQILPLVQQLQNLPSAPTIDIPAGAADAIAAASDLSSLALAALQFQDLHDEASIFLGPAIAQGIDGAQDFASDLAKLANAGVDMVNMQVQLLSAQTKVVQTGLKMQAAQANLGQLTSLVTSMQGTEAAVGRAIFALSTTVLDHRMRALDLVYQACSAFEYAHNSRCPALSAMPDPSSSYQVFQSAITNSLTGLDTVWSASQCFCNVSWIEEDPGFIGNLSSTGKAVLDFTDLNNFILQMDFSSSWDNVHMYQMNLKPYGIKPLNWNHPGVYPTLKLYVAPTGEFINTFTDPLSNTRYIRNYVAPPYTFAVSMQPTNSWTVTTPGSLTDNDAARFYVPTPYTRFSVYGDPEMVAQWDWSEVWGVQVELWGYATNAPSASASKNGNGMCSSSCASASKVALHAIGAA